MKLILVLCMFVGLPLYAQNNSKEPETLTKARAKYQKEVARVTAPITKDYLDQLDTLKKALGAKGDVEDAMAVQKEIDAVATPAEDQKDWLDGTTWAMISRPAWLRKFERGKCFAIDTAAGRSWTADYEITSAKSVTIHMPDGSTTIYPLQKDKTLLVDGRYSYERKPKP